MATEPRLALQQLIAALERHFEAMSSKRSEDDPAVTQAYEVLKDSYLDYEEAVDERFEEWLPFELADNEEESD